MGKALCVVTVFCLDTIRQLLSLDVVKCCHIYLCHSTLPYPYCRMDMLERKRVWESLRKPPFMVCVGLLGCIRY